MSAFSASLRRAWPVMAAYGVFTVWGAGCLVASLGDTSGGLGAGPGALGVVLGVLLAMAGGQVLGNVLGLAGLRFAVVAVVFTAAFVLSGLSSAALGPYALFLVIGVLAALGGYLGVASRFDVVASWFPLALSVGAALIRLNSHATIDTFRTGAKYAIWDPFAIVCLSGAVFLNLVFLATRHSLGLTVWQEVGRPAATRAAAGPAVAVARPGRGSLLVLLAFSIVVLAATALISPYLFRTYTPENGDRSDKGQINVEGSEKSKHREHREEKGEGERKPTFGKPDTDGASQAAAAAMEMALRLLAMLLATALVLLLLVAVGWAPARRAFLLRHLERPIWPTSPTTRVINLWRRALAALAVVDVLPAAGEAPRAFAARASQEVGASLAEGTSGLLAAAEIVERVDYAGRGLGAGDEQTMREAVTAVVTAVRARAPLKKRLAAYWGPAPEIEA